MSKWAYSNQSVLPSSEERSINFITRRSVAHPRFSLTLSQHELLLVGWCKVKVAGRHHEEWEEKEEEKGGSLHIASTLFPHTTIAVTITIIFMLAATVIVSSLPTFPLDLLQSESKCGEMEDTLSFTVLYCTPLYCTKARLFFINILIYSGSNSYFWTIWSRILLSCWWALWNRTGQINQRSQTDLVTNFYRKIHGDFDREWASVYNCRRRGGRRGGSWRRSSGRRSRGRWRSAYEDGVRLICDLEKSFLAEWVGRSRWESWRHIMQCSTREMKSDETRLGGLNSIG